MQYIGKWLHFWAGYDMSRQLDAGLFIGFFPHEAKGLLRRYKLAIEASWNWLPIIQRVYYSVSSFDLGEVMPMNRIQRWFKYRPRVVGVCWPFIFHVRRN